MAADYPGGTRVAHAYDAGGRRVAMTDPWGTTTFAYDALDRLVEAVDAPGGTVRHGCLPPRV